MNRNLESRAQSLIDALIDGDLDAVQRHQGWLMGECAAGLLNQDGETLADLRAAVADLAAVGDRYGPGKPGDRWRAVWELLHAIGATTRPLEQLRLARPERVSGQLLRLIRDRPGISPSAMVEALGKKANHVSNALRGLIDQGLVDRVTRGREVDYYLTGPGREALADEAPAQAPVPAAGMSAPALSLAPSSDHASGQLAAGEAQTGLAERSAAELTGNMAANQSRASPSFSGRIANDDSYLYLEHGLTKHWASPGQRPEFRRRPDARVH